ncbi:hypothetical protein WJX74_009641 [Apatococcus lobatus]|uniref:Uncharacterized protein n=2 Tax=Apatococcus TaxID=904362 RepID=A0AAW1SRL3_9CHLO
MQSACLWLHRGPPSVQRRLDSLCSSQQAGTRSPNLLSKKARLGPRRCTVSVRAEQQRPAESSGQAPQPGTSSGPSSPDGSSSSSGSGSSEPTSLPQEQEAAGEEAAAAAAKLAQQPTAESRQSSETAMLPFEQGSDPVERSLVDQWLNPDKSELPGDFNMPIWDHLDELRERVLVAALAALVSVLACFAFSRDLVVFLEAPVASQGVRFLQLSPGEFFFTTLKVAGYAGLLLSTPTVLYEVCAYIIPGLTKSERRFLAPIIFGSSILFFFGLAFAYEILTPAALNFFVTYAEGAVESLWSIDQYFEFVLVLLLSTGLAFQVPVIQILLGNTGLVTSKQMLSQWRFVIVGATIAAAVLTPSTDPFTQTLLAAPLIGLYFGGCYVVKFIEGQKAAPQPAS